MIQSQKDGITITGVSLGVEMKQITPDRQAKELVPKVAGSNGWQSPAGILYVDGDRFDLYLVKETAVAGGKEVRLYGSVRPITTVNLSKGGTAITPWATEPEQIATVTPDGNGAWEYTFTPAEDMFVAAWIKKPNASPMDATSVGLTISAGTGSSGETPVTPDPGAYLIEKGFHAEPSSWSGSDPGLIVFNCVVNGPEDLRTIKLYGVIPSTGEEVLLGESGGGAINVNGFPYETSNEMVVDFRVTGTTDQADGAITSVDVMQYAEGTCLSGDTLITLTDGGQKRLEEVRPGDLLLAGDGTPTRAARTARGLFNPYHTLYHFEDGTVVDEIHDHRFYNVEQGFWQYLRNWRVGEHARRKDGAQVALAGVERVDERKEMFGLWTGSHDYWANGLLSGETAANQALLADATAEQAADMAASLGELAILRLMGIDIEEGLLP